MRIFTLFLFFLLLIPIAFSEYENTGKDGTFLVDEGDLNGLNADAGVTALRSISDIGGHVLIRDLNLDNVSDILVLNTLSGQLEIYHNSSLSAIEHVLSLPECVDYEHMSNPVTAQLDGDAPIEYIVHCKNSLGQMYIIEYNSTGLFIEKNYTMGGRTNRVYSDSMLGCNEINRTCVLAGASSTNGGLNTGYNQIGFNLTHVAAGTILVGGSGGTAYTWCHPKIKSAPTADLDNDGKIETIIVTTLSLSGTDKFYVWTLYPKTGAVYATDQSTNWNAFDIGAGGNNCNTNVNGERQGDYISSAVIGNLDAFDSDGKEFIIAYHDSVTQWNIHVYDGDFTEVQENPVGASYVDGDILSNPVIGDFWSGNGAKEYCVFGSDDVDQEIKVVCGSLLESVLLLDTKFFKIGYGSYWELSNIYRQGKEHEYLFTAGDQFTESVSDEDSDTQGNFDPDEFILPWGIFKIDDDSNCPSALSYNCSMTKLVDNPRGAGGLIVASMQGNNRSDMLIVRNDDISYFDDGYENSDPYIGSVEINPCTTSVWKQNTTVTVVFDVNDDDSSPVADKISANASLYYGTSKEKAQNWTIYYDDGTLLSFTWTANETISGGIISINIRDNYDPTNNLVNYQYGFSVATNGVEYGDCTTTEEEGTTTDEDATTNETVTNTGNNAITNAVNEIGSVSNLGQNIIWLLLMVIVAVGIWMYAPNGSHGAAFGVIVFAEVGLLIVGGLLGLISTGIVFTFIILTLGVIAIIMRKLFFGQHGGS